VLVDVGCVDTDSAPADFNNGAKLGFFAGGKCWKVDTIQTKSKTHDVK